VDLSIVSERVANAWAVAWNRSRNSIAYRVRIIERPEQPCVGLILRGRQGPHSIICISVQDARRLADDVKQAANKRGQMEGSDLSHLHDRELTTGDRLRRAWSILRGAARVADVWVVHYMLLRSGTELVMIELGTRRERKAHARLPLTLGDAADLAEEMDRAVAMVSGPRT
jgi:hypothetical protein